MSLPHKFMELFQGSTKSFGIYTTDKVKKGLKLGGSAKAIRRDLSVSDWESHLQGKNRLAIVPINEQCNSFFGVIDLDVYNNQAMIDLVNGLIKKHKVPVLPCFSKSGGLHIYLFLSEPVKSSFLREKLKEIAAVLGCSNESEIFPKQDKILVEQGDMGNFINMPYFGDTCIHKDLSQEDFIKKAYGSRITLAQLEKLTFVVEKGPFHDGPPCLQYLAKDKVGEGYRNETLFHMGVYYRKKHPESWAEKVDKANKDFFTTPLPSNEVSEVIKSLNKKTYHYRCSVSPMCNHCDAVLCKNTPYGIDTTNNLPEIQSMTRLDSKPPVFFLSIGDKRLMLESGDLLIQNRFSLRCIEQINTLPSPMKPDDWIRLVNHLLSKAVVIPVAVEETALGVLISHLKKFCLGPRQKNKLDAISSGGVFHDSESKTHNFKLSDFVAFLEKHNYQKRDIAIQRVSANLRQYFKDSIHFKQVRVDKGSMRYIIIPEFEPKAVDNSGLAGDEHV